MLNEVHLLKAHDYQITIHQFLLATLIKHLQSYRPKSHPESNVYVHAKNSPPYFVILILTIKMKRVYSNAKYHVYIMIYNNLCFDEENRYYHKVNHPYYFNQLNDYFKHRK